MKAKIFVCVLMVCVSIRAGYADTVHLKNGRKIEGFIKNEDENSVALEIGIGIVGFHKNEIERIEKASADENRLLGEQFRQQKIESSRRQIEQRKQRDSTPKKAEILEENGQLVIEALLNRKIKVNLILDTGASLVLLMPSAAKKLGFDAELKPDDKKNTVECTLADGRKCLAKRVIIDTISVQGNQAENIEAALLLNDVNDPKLRDGLLGMSFLKQFSFKIDVKNKKLSLERLR